MSIMFGSPTSKLLLVVVTELAPLETVEVSEAVAIGDVVTTLKC